MEGASNDKYLEEWPTLDAEHNGASASNNKNEKSKSENKSGRKKKKNSQWKNATRINVDTPSYRNERRSSHNYQEYHSSNGNGSYNVETSVRGNAHRGGYRGNRGRGNNRGNRFRGSNQHHRYFMSTANGNNTTEVQELSSTTYYNPTLSYVDPQALIKHEIRTQVEFYFSEYNLLSDFFLRQNMNVHGYAPLSLIETFPRMRNLNCDRQLIVEAIKESNKLEIQDDFLIRPVVDPQRWPVSPQFVSHQTLEHQMSNLSINNNSLQQYPGQPVYVPFAPPFVAPPNFIPAPVPIQNTFMNGDSQVIEHLGMCATKSGEPSTSAVTSLYCGDVPSTSAIPIQSVYYGDDTSSAVHIQSDYCAVDPSSSDIPTQSDFCKDGPSSSEILAQSDYCDPSSSEIPTQSDYPDPSSSEIPIQSDYCDPSLSEIPTELDYHKDGPTSGKLPTQDYGRDDPSSSAVSIQSDYYGDGPSTSSDVSTKLDSTVYCIAEPSRSCAVSDYSGSSSPTELSYSLPQENVILYHRQNNHGYHAYSIPSRIEGLSEYNDCSEKLKNTSPEPPR